MSKKQTAEAPAAVYLDPKTLKAWDKNPRNNAEAVASVSKSIQRFGFASPIIARESDGRIIAGHTRLKAALSLGLDSVPVRFMDLDDQSAAALALADNRIGEIATWDEAGLSAILADLEANAVDLDGLGWDADELADLLTPTFEPDGSEDDVPEVQAEVHSVPGAVYELGPHRLVCGDCTDPAVWDSVIGDERLRCVWTDPPYGVGIVGGSHAIDPAKRIKMGHKTIQNDAMTPEDTAALWSDAFKQLQRVSEPGSAWYASGPQGLIGVGWQTCAVLDRFGMKRTLVWIKNSLVMGRSDYHYRHEPIYYGWFDGAARLHPVPSAACSVFEYPRPSVSKEHPTMKPVDLIRAMIENSTDGNWIVGDPFAGSGTTLIACAMTGRRARLIELDPQYCDVIRRRWTKWATEHGQEPGPGALDTEAM